MKNYVDIKELIIMYLVLFSFEGDKQTYDRLYLEKKNSFTAISFLENYGSRGWNQAPFNTNCTYGRYS